MAAIPLSVRTVLLLCAYVSFCSAGILSFTLLLPPKPPVCGVTLVVVAAAIGSVNLITKVIFVVLDM